jgi:uncharacterized protein YjbJ (UPF0337 family)
MGMNENKFKGKWLEIKGDIQKNWGKLTDNELEKTKGDIKSIRGLIQQRYGDAEEKSSKKLENIFKRFENKKDSVVYEAKKAIKP